MGVLNVTPDSFSDGGEFNSEEKALKVRFPRFLSNYQRAQEMVASGADIIDIGGQSTRPGTYKACFPSLQEGATRVSEDEELSRVIPTIKAIRQSGITTALSIDTFYAKVAKEAGMIGYISDNFSVMAGANVINDVTGGTLEPNILKVASELKVPICLMHMKVWE